MTNLTIRERAKIFHLTRQIGHRLRIERKKKVKMSRMKELRAIMMKMEIESKGNTLKKAKNRTVMEKKLKKEKKFKNSTRKVKKASNNKTMKTMAKKASKNKTIEKRVSSKRSMARMVTDCIAKVGFSINRISGRRLRKYMCNGRQKT